MFVIFLYVSGRTCYIGLHGNQEKERELILWFNLLSKTPNYMLGCVKFQILTEVTVFRMGWFDTVQFGNDLPAFRMNVWHLSSGYMETLCSVKS